MLVPVRDGVAGRAAHHKIATGNDADADLHRTVTPDAGLMSPSHIPAVAIDHFDTHRPGWPHHARRSEDGLDSSLIDRVAPDQGRGLLETPVGFKWFVPGLLDSSSRSAARRAPVRRSCAATAACGPPTRTASSWPCSPPRSSPSRGRRQAKRYAKLTPLRGARLRPRRRPRPRPRRRPRSGKLAPSERPRPSSRATPSRGPSDAPGNGAAIGGLKIDTEEELVRRAPVRHRGRLQDLRQSFRGPAHRARSSRRRRALVHVRRSGG